MGDAEEIIIACIIFWVQEIRWSWLHSMEAPSFIHTRQGRKGREGGEKGWQGWQVAGSYLWFGQWRQDKNTLSGNWRRSTLLKYLDGLGQCDVWAVGKECVLVCLCPMDCSPFGPSNCRPTLGTCFSIKDHGTSEKNSLHSIHLSMVGQYHWHGYWHGHCMGCCVGHSTRSTWQPLRAQS